MTYINFDKMQPKRVDESDSTKVALSEEQFKEMYIYKFFKNLEKLEKKQKWDGRMGPGFRPGEWERRAGFKMLDLSNHLPNEVKTAGSNLFSPKLEESSENMVNSQDDQLDNEKKSLEQQIIDLNRELSVARTQRVDYLIDYENLKLKYNRLSLIITSIITFLIAWIFLTE